MGALLALLVACPCRPLLFAVAALAVLWVTFVVVVVGVAVGLVVAAVLLGAFRRQVALVVVACCRLFALVVLVVSVVLVVFPRLPVLLVLIALVAVLVVVVLPAAVPLPVLHSCLHPQLAAPD